MSSLIKQGAQQKAVLGTLRNFNEVVEFLGGLKQIDHGESVIKRMQELDKLFDNVSQKIDTILVGGSSSKATTIDFAAKLLKEENTKVGVAYASHLLSYTERLAFNSEQISQKDFTEILNEVINVSELNEINATAFELMTIAALLYFKSLNTDVVLFEVGIGGLYDATNICSPQIAVITSVTDDNKDILSDDLDKAAQAIVGITRKNCWVVSAEKSKIRLQKMKAWVEARGGKWVMPIRKLSPLPYIYEQLYGRIASLAERIAQIYVEEVRGKFSPFLRGSLLATQRGQRGRPTLEAKKNAELNPIKTLRTFWVDQFALMHGQFELLDKEKPTMLLDSASNIESFVNLFLGVRLLNYQRPIKGLTLLVGVERNVDLDAFMKQVRYLFKKISGQILFVPLSKEHHSPEALEALSKEMNVKAKATKDFAEAFNLAKESVDERNGLVVITGSPQLVAQYWELKGIKKIN